MESFGWGMGETLRKAQAGADMGSRAGMAIQSDGPRRDLKERILPSAVVGRVT